MLINNKLLIKYICLNYCLGYSLGIKGVEIVEAEK